MNHIPLFIQATTEADFETGMLKLGLAEMGPDPDNPKGPQIALYPDVLGVDEPGAMDWLPDKSSKKVVDPETKQETGQYSKNLPGLYYNLRVVYRPERNGKTSLAEKLIHKENETDADGKPVKYEQDKPKEVGKEDLPAEKKLIWERTFIKDKVDAKDREEKLSRGFTGDPKCPEHLSIKNSRGDVVFRVLNGEQINSPANTFA